MRPGAGGHAPDEARDGLHPAFRVLLLLALAAMVFRYSLTALTLVLAALLLGASAAGGGVLRSIFLALRRIRWLLLSIVVIYLWIAPEPAGPGQAWYAPGWDELDTALQRSGVLVVLVAAVELLRQRTGAARMAAGLVMLLAPLRRIGVDVEQFARRLALTLEAVPLTIERVARAAGGLPSGRGLARWGERAATLLREIETDAVAAPRTAGLPRLAPPGRTDWAWLALGVATLLLVGRL
jgi:energy-coupling factor transporter transmembrane protein EcfT